MAAGQLFGELLNLGGNTSNITENITKNRLTETAIDMTNIFQQTSSDCTNFNEVAFYDCDVKDISILQNGMCKLNIKDRMSAKIQSKITQTADVKAIQYAKDIVQSIGINAGSINAENIGNTASTSTATIKNRINQICKNIATNVNTFTCQNVHGLYGDYVAQDSIVNSTVNCAMAANVVNDTTQSMTQVTNQYASGTEDDALTMGALGMFAIYIAYLLNSILIGSKTFNLILLLITVALIIAAVGIFWYYKRYPPNPRPMGDRCADCTKFGQQDACEKSSCKWTGHKGEMPTRPDYPSLSPLCVCDPTFNDCTLQCYLQKDEKSCGKANCFWDSNNNICTGDKSHCHGELFN